MDAAPFNQGQAGRLRLIEEKPAPELPLPPLQWPPDLFADEAPSH